jgi:arylsulfatase A-like enzyme
MRYLTTFFIIIQSFLVNYACFAKPNIVILFADDAGYMDFGFTGTDDLQTPRIDQFATEGVICTQGYVTASVCSPSRAGLLTGRYQQRFGHETNLRGKDVGLPLTERTMANRLGDLGYTTCAIGKWHLGGSYEQHPLSRGFDAFHGFLLGSRTYFSKPNNNVTQQSLMHNRVIVPEDDNRYLTDWMATKANEFIKIQTKQPFFLYVAFNAVHTPMQATPEDLSHFSEIEDSKRKKLAGMTLALDRAVGSIMDTLKEQGLDENTIVFFLNDNGGATINASNNGPLRGMKGSKWEGGIRVPYVVRWKNNLMPSLYNKPVSSLDIAATSLTLAGDTAESMDDLDGINILPFLTGSEKGIPHDILCWRRGPAGAVRSGAWKLIRVDDQPPLLFHVNNDIGETNNLAESNPEKVEELLSYYATWESEMVEPLWVAKKVWTDRQIAKHKMDVIGREAERKIP